MKIICIGRNYAEHAKELNNAVPTEPVIFLKPDTAFSRNNQPFYYPDFSSDIHYEVELVVKISHPGKNIEEKFAHKYYNEISLGVDFTARDLQQKFKEKGLPWEKAKAFDGSAAVGNFVSKNSVENIHSVDFSLNINEKTVQQGNTKDMIFSIDAIIAYVSKYFTLKTGDLIFTGTPAGVGPIKKDDVLEAFLQEDKLLKLKVK
jgi:acylpyruvate hydrolase